MIPLRAYLAAGAIAAAFGAGWLANGWRLGQDAAQLQARAEHERAEAFRYMAAEQTRNAQALTALDAAAQRKLSDAETDLARFERCIAVGAGCGLRVKIRPVPARVPGSGAAACVGDRDGGAAELAADVGPDYRALRTGIVRLEEALRVCIAAGRAPAVRGVVN